MMSLGFDSLMLTTYNMDNSDNEVSPAGTEENEFVSDSDDNKSLPDVDDNDSQNSKSGLLRQLSKLDDFIRCEICLELYDVPMSLPCGHVFCSDCCDRIQHHTRLTCPICRKECKVSDLRLDYHTRSLVESYTPNEEQLQNASLHRSPRDRSSSVIPRVHRPLSRHSQPRYMRPISDVMSTWMGSLNMRLYCGFGKLVLTYMALLGIALVFFGVKHSWWTQVSEDERVLDLVKDDAIILRKEISKEVATLFKVQALEIKNTQDIGKSSLLSLNDHREGVMEEIETHYESLRESLNKEIEKYIKNVINDTISVRVGKLLQALESKSNKDMFIALTKSRKCLRRGCYDFHNAFHTYTLHTVSNKDVLSSPIVSRLTFEHDKLPSAELTPEEFTCTLIIEGLNWGINLLPLFLNFCAVYYTYNQQMLWNTEAAVLINIIYLIVGNALILVVRNAVPVLDVCVIV